MAEEEYEEEEAVEGEEEDDGKPKQSSREAHEKQKVLRQERKSNKPGYEVITDAKKIWEKLRRGDCDRDERIKLMKDIMELIEGRVSDLIFKHDASRVIQTCLKFGNSAQRNIIAGELTGHYLVLSKSMYGKFIVTKVLEYCHKYRDTILSELKNNIRKLIRHKEASTVIETFYGQHANAQQRKALLAEFYGPEFTLFAKKSKDAEIHTIDELLEKHPEKKDGVLRYMAETLGGCTDKGTVGNSIIHKALFEYFSRADEKGIQNMMEQLKDQLAEIVHTKEGSQVAMLCIAHASPKDRKHLIKVLKPFLNKIAKDEYGHLVILTLMDVVDDTVLVSKAVLGELSKSMTELLQDKFSRRIYLYLLVGRNTKYFHPSTIQLISANDEVRSKTSKKDPEVRAKELLTATSSSMIDQVTEHTGELMREKMSSQVVREIMLHALGDKTAAVDAILKLCDDNIEKENHIIEHRFANRAIKALIKADTAEASDDRAVEPLGFAPKLFDTIQDNLVHFATSQGGSFVILSLAEEPSTQKKTLAALKSHKKELKAAAVSEAEGSKGNLGAKMLLDLLDK
ncbi:armadillo-type protein [Umbelopsis sp. AD052]|nr:armadillo-type protein [Umbelopsis sp. AD052]